MIIHVGNINSFITGSPSYQEFMSREFNNHFLNKRVISVSRVKNKFLRLCDVTLTFLRYSFSSPVVIIHSFSTQAFYMSLWAAILCKLFSLKYYLLLHGGNYPERILKSPKLVFFLFSNAKEVIAPSQYLKKCVELNGYACTLIYNSIDIKSLNFKVRENFEPNILWVRSFISIYNPLMAVQVFEKILLKYPEAKLTMVGGIVDQSFKMTYDYTKSSTFSDRVLFTGKLTMDEWFGLSESHSLFINTTNIDNTPLSVIQAMALGLPVFSTNVGGIPYLLKDGVTGFLSAPNDPNSMAERIVYGLENQELLKHVSLRARRQSEDLGWDKISNFWYERLA